MIWGILYITGLAFFSIITDKWFRWAMTFCGLAKCIFLRLFCIVVLSHTVKITFNNILSTTKSILLKSLSSLYLLSVLHIWFFSLLSSAAFHPFEYYDHKSVAHTLVSSAISPHSVFSLITVLWNKNLFENHQ